MVSEMYILLLKLDQTKENQASVLVRFLKFSDVCGFPNKTVGLFPLDLVGSVCLTDVCMVLFCSFKQM